MRVREPHCFFLCCANVEILSQTLDLGYVSSSTSSEHIFPEGKLHTRPQPTEYIEIALITFAEAGIMQYVL